tara:strand:- start:126 stop:1262 length:1137 start_codon:yes stop_codon:yes gene_type:complete
MFRGGPVDSRGTGITANLGYNNGGRVGYNQAGFVVQPPSASGLFSIQDILKQTGAPMTGKQILEFAKDKQLNLGRDFKINPFSKYIPENVEVQVGEDTVEKPFGEIIREKGFQFYEDPNEEYLGKGDTQGTTGDKTSDGGRTFTSNFGTTEQVAKNLNNAESKIDTSLLSDNPVLNNQNTANEELTLEEVRDSLGYKKAFRRDLGDTFGRGAAAFIGAESLTEGAKKFFEAEAASGPGRAEKIETAAGTFMLKDKAARSRDKAKVDLMRADTDYKIAAGKKQDIAESVLSVVKQGLPTDAKLASAIQNATSSNTGDKYKFKGVVMFKDLNSVLSSGKLKIGDTLIVKKVVKDPSTNVEKTQKKIIEVTETGFEEIFNI